MVRVVLSLLAAVALLAAVHGGDVTYDGRSLFIDGQRKLLFSGSVHYPRSTPEMWRSLIWNAKAGGLDVIDTYVFWNLHEPQPGQYEFSGRADIVRFIKEVQAQGLYVCLRIGPFIQAEWSYGGLPIWLRDIPNIVFRTDNEPFKFYMQNFTTKIVRMLQAEKLYASQGGPIILSQIENEYTLVEGTYGGAGKGYVKWAAQMAVGLKTGVPWVMCRQNDAPDPVINACNGLRCGETFPGPNSPNKPAIWTENWTTRYVISGEDIDTRSAQDIAFHVALFLIAKNGSFFNYYMYHGGTNFGRSAAAFIPTSYYDQAPIDEYGFVREPKWGHLKELHIAVKLCLAPLLTGAQTVLSLGQQQQAYVYKGASGECAAFLLNNDTKNTVSVQFQGGTYDLPPRSISILPDCKNVAYNTAKVTVQYTSRSMTRKTLLDGPQGWTEYKEGIPNFDQSPIKAQTLLEQMSTTKDVSDYLWYTFKLTQQSPDPNALLDVYSLGHVLHAFVNGQAVGYAQGSHKNERFNAQIKTPLNGGVNYLSLLSVMVGLPDSGGHQERRGAGLRRVKIQSPGLSKDISNSSWGYQVGLLGEKLRIYTRQGSTQVQWSPFSNNPNPLTWYKTTFDAPAGDKPVALNLGSMGKGEAWVNGQSIGRYWPAYRSPDGSSQIWYHVPRSFLATTGNLLILMEESGGNPLQISIDTVSISQVCSHMSGSYSPPVSSWRQVASTLAKMHYKKAIAKLECPLHSKISKIVFASYGTPSGNCTTNTYFAGSCHSSASKAIAQKACVGKKKCSIPVTNKYFGGDPCSSKQKSLLVVAECK